MAGEIEIARHPIARSTRGKLPWLDGRSGNGSTSQFVSMPVRRPSYHRPVFERLRCHPFAVEAYFRWSLVLTYALPARVLQPLLPRGLTLDTYDQWGFLAIALVQTEDLRPKGLPRALGRDFFLSGYRVFTRFVRPGNQSLRGLRILRSDTDRRAMVRLGNLFTHYGYRLARVAIERDGDRLGLSVKTPEREADIDVDVDVGCASELPEGSPFRSIDDARKFAGPLPYTFDLDERTGKMIVVRGLRKAWNPRPVRVLSHAASFLERSDLAAGGPRLANAFYVENVSYAWKAGVLEEIA